MLLFQGRGPKLFLAVAIVLTCVIVLYLSSFPSLAEWKLPSPSGWKFPLSGHTSEHNGELPPGSDPVEQGHEKPPLTSDPQDQGGPVSEDEKWEPIEHEYYAPPDETTSVSTSSASLTTSTSSVSLSTSTSSLSLSTLTSSASLSTSTMFYGQTSLPPMLTSTEAPAKTGTGHIDDTGYPCHNLKGAEDVLVIMRTGATEMQDKLPAHLDTTFDCFPNVVVFSDYEEDYRGYQIHDVLKNIPDTIKMSSEQFKHYLHIQDVGREGLDPSELSGAVSEETGDGTGKGDNPGWALDKWKFLPMINETLALHPDKKWYVFVEPDSYLVWSNFLQWLPHLDPNKPAYYGSEAMIGDVIFAHGGSVFLLTQPAMQKVADDFNNRTNDLLDYTARSWAGDGVLAKVLNDNGVPLTFTWPQFQGGNPAYTTDWEGTKGNTVLWCAPALSYHHLIPSEVIDIFLFEQDWIEDVHASLADRGLPLSHSDPTTLLHHKETFKMFIQPNMTNERHDWDAKNDFDDDLHAPTPDLDLAGCRAQCKADSNCMQYTLAPDGCRTHFDGPRGPRLGQASKGFKSGWIYDRVKDWVHKMDACTHTDWTTTS